MTAYNLGIDVETKDVVKLLEALSGLASTVHATNGGKYHEDGNYSQVWVSTTMTETQLDDWLYTAPECIPVSWIGVFDRTGA